MLHPHISIHLLVEGIIRNVGSSHCTVEETNCDSRIQIETEWLFQVSIIFVCLPSGLFGFACVDEQVCALLSAACLSWAELQGHQPKNSLENSL